jgi:glycerol-3-phosphate dehydrogenase (NAD(P)+)
LRIEKKSLKNICMILGSRITIIGAGAWGTALAIIANRAGADVTLWSRSEKLAQEIQITRVNSQYLPNIFVDPAIKITADLDLAIKNTDLLLLSIPAQSIRGLSITLSDIMDIDIPIIIASKGIERGSLLLMSEVIASTLPSNPLLILSGPNFAVEAANGLPTATVIACSDINIAQKIQFLIGGRYFRPYVSDDVVSVQIGGAIKNVIAIACGIAIGAGMGENARAAIMTRGLKEMMRLAEIKGGRAETLRGLAGMGDLTLSCCSEKSRNMAFGINIGKMSMQKKNISGKSSEVPSTWHSLTEGVMTADAAYEISQKFGVPMPISVTTADILKKRISVEEGIEALLARPLGGE